MVQDQEGDFGVVMAFRSFFKMVWPDFHGNFLEMVLMRVFSPLLHSLLLSAMVRSSLSLSLSFGPKLSQKTP